MAARVNVQIEFTFLLQKHHFHKLIKLNEF